MKRLLLGLLIILLALTSCDLQMVKEGESINQYILPYLEFVINEFADSFSARVVEGAKVESVYIPASIVINGVIYPVTDFLGFRNPDDAVNLKTITLASSEISISSEALAGVGDEVNIGIENVEDAAVWGELPVLEKAGEEFLGWFYADSQTPVRAGEAILGQVSPRWRTHNLVFVPEETSCTEAGHKAHYKCLDCNKLFEDAKGLVELSDVSLPAAGHSMNFVPEVPATCEKTGVKAHYECLVCGGAYSDEEGKLVTSDLTLAALGHAWEEEVIGSQTVCYCYKCANCKQTKEPKDHSWDDGVVTVPATQTSCGKKKYTCEKCGLEKTVDVDPSDPSHVHVWEDLETVAKSCTTDGYTVHKCSSCGLEERYNVDVASGHSLDFVAAVAATCVKDGNSAYYRCEVCGGLFTDENGLISTTAEAVVVAKHGVTYVEGKATVSCSEPGYHEYWHCAVCNKDFFDANCTREITTSSPNVISIAHEESGSFFNKGTEGHLAICANCNQPYGNLIAHSKVRFEWTHDENGHWHRCSAQGCVYQFEFAAHSYESYGTDQICSICGHVKGGQESSKHGDFNIQEVELVPKGTLTVEAVSSAESRVESGASAGAGSGANTGSGALVSVGGGARHKATFSLASGSVMTGISWYLDGSLVPDQNGMIYEFTTPEYRTYKVMCVVFNGTLVKSYETAVFGGE